MNFGGLDFGGIGSFAGGMGSLFTGSSNLGNSIIGQDVSAKQNTNTDTEEKKQSTSKLNIDQEAITKTIKDILGDVGGMADIFQGEKAGGLYNSTVAAQASGDLAAKIVGEIAKLTATQVSTETGTSKVRANSKSEQDQEGWLESFAAPIENFIGKLF